MPTRVAVDDDEQQIQDLIKELRRLRSRLATTTVKGTHDEFTVAATPETTYQLTYIPVTGTCAMFNDKHEQEEGTAYTVDYDTGIVTFVTALTTAQRINFRYLVTDWLIARSLTPDTGIIADNFNRANSTSSLGNTSTGNVPWAAPTGTWGINGNQAYQSGAGGDLFATVDTGDTDGTLQVTLATIPGSLSSQRPALLFWYQNTTNFFMFQATPGGYTLWKVIGGTATVEDSVSVTPASGDVLKVVLSGHTIDFYLNGTHRGVQTNAAYATATKHGLYTSSSDTSTRFDDFSFVLG